MLIMDGDGSLNSSLVIRSWEDESAKELDFVDGSKWRKEDVLGELKKQVALGGPLVTANLLQKCMQIVSVMFVGHLGELPLAGASMATSFANAIGFSVLCGMGSALDTLCGQAYGAKQYHMVGVHAQRAQFIFLIVGILISLILYNTEDILQAVGQDALLSKEAGSYAIWMIPTLFPYSLIQTLTRFLQTQNDVLPIMLSTGITSLLHLPICWVLVSKSGFGAKGAALANSVSYFLNVILLSLYVNFSASCVNTWTGFSMEAFQDIAQFFRLAIPSTVMGCLEWASYEILILLSGLLPNPKLEASVLAICLNTESLTYAIPQGVGDCISTRVSNELGAGNPRRAVFAIRVTLLLVILDSLLVGAIILVVHNFWGYLYSNEQEVVDYVSRLTPLLVIANIMDGTQCMLSGVTRGSGRQNFGALAILGAYYGVGIPMAIILAFYFNAGTKGLWMGVICGSFLQGLSLLIMTISTNWEQEARKATDKAFHSSIPAINAR
ncbi:hypothetical protein AMTRI_Chr13g119390 [Amborella trichopoda]|uniref:protein DETOXIFICATION 16 n=1 Tax=Amborella trichopoda TaxID=13333 RepID=UPI0009C140FD|nr:protein DETOXIFICATION 16 [Amborella trichopoda]|eukprot:XP_020522774.1 protein DETOXIFICATION 16 [Amborella trichopoda]